MNVIKVTHFGEVMYFTSQTSCEKYLGILQPSVSRAISKNISVKKYTFELCKKNEANELEWNQLADFERNKIVLMITPEGERHYFESPKSCSDWFDCSRASIIYALRREDDKKFYKHHFVSIVKMKDEYEYLKNTLGMENIKLDMIE